MLDSFTGGEIVNEAADYADKTHHHCRIEKSFLSGLAGKDVARRVQTAKKSEQRIKRNAAYAGAHAAAQIAGNIDGAAVGIQIGGKAALHDTVVFEKYNSKTNKHVRIVFRDGEFHYLMCGASDNWKEITEVPLEIDEVVTTMLFKS